MFQVAREVDKLALEEAGYLNCVSVPHVPHGAQTKAIDKKSKSEVCNLSFIFLFEIPEVVIAYDICVYDITVLIFIDLFLYCIIG